MFRAPYPRVTYPLSAVVDVDDMRLALLLDAVSPAAGGVLMRGEEGTAKSTTVRPLAAPDVACTDGPYEPKTVHGRATVAVSR